MKKKKDADSKSAEGRRERGLKRVIVWLGPDHVRRIEKIQRELKRGAVTSWDTSTSAAIRTALERATDAQ